MPSHRNEYPLACSEEGCEATHPRTHWDKKKAQELGWFFQKDGRSWCPKHNPPWVADWRANQLEGE